MRELGIFVDESGDFGSYEDHSSHYIISLVLHDQSHGIGDCIASLESALDTMGYSGHCLHAGPLIRNEEKYRKIDFADRQRLLRCFMRFFRVLPVFCMEAHIDKKEVADAMDAVGRLSKEIARLIRDNLKYFQSFDIVKVYYDNGQTEVNKILVSVFNSLLSNVEFRKVSPLDYRLFQIADLVCSLSLLRIKHMDNELTEREVSFFRNARTLRKNYLALLDTKELRFKL